MNKAEEYLSQSKGVSLGR